MNDHRAVSDPGTTTISLAQAGSECFLLEQNMTFLQPCFRSWGATSKTLEKRECMTNPKILPEMVSLPQTDLCLVASEHGKVRTNRSWPQRSVRGLRAAAPAGLSPKGSDGLREKPITHRGILRGRGPLQRS